MRPLRFGAGTGTAVRRKRLWSVTSCLIAAFLLYMFHFVVRLDPVPASRQANHRPIEYRPKRASNGLFVSIHSYLVDSDIEGRKIGPTIKEDDLVLIILGMGDLGSNAQDRKDEWKGKAPPIPRLYCEMRLPNGIQERIGEAYLHVTGTAYENSISSRGYVRYFGERALMISCGIPKRIETQLRSLLVDIPQTSQSSQAEFRLVGVDYTFDSTWMMPEWFLASSVPKNHVQHNVLCSTPIFDFTGSRWLTEWILYHRNVLRYDEIHLYMAQNGEKTMKTITHLAQAHGGIVVHNWTSVLNGADDGLDPFQGVGHGVPKSQGYEHAQRLVRTDCYLRNRGRNSVTILDPDEYLYISRGSGTGTIQHISEQCEASGKFICRLKSVTAHPVRVKKGDTMFIRSLDPRCEKRCQDNFNCGDYYYGREKYMIRASSHAPLPWTTLAIHSVSDNLEFAKRYGDFVVPKTDAFVKHYNPHPYKATGGLLPENAVMCPFPEEALATVSAAIEADVYLRQLYQSDFGEEAFLRLDRADDPNRFSQ